MVFFDDICGQGFDCPLFEIVRKGNFDAFTSVHLFQFLVRECVDDPCLLSGAVHCHLSTAAGTTLDRRVARCRCILLLLDPRYALLPPTPTLHKGTYQSLRANLPFLDSIK